jgi:hypothetical protein
MEMLSSSLLLLLFFLVYLNPDVCVGNRRKYELSYKTLDGKMIKELIRQIYRLSSYLVLVKLKSRSMFYLFFGKILFSSINFK